MALLHPIFADLVENVNLHSPTQEDNAFVRGLSNVVSQRSKSEHCETFHDLLNKHYQIQLYAASVGASKRVTDGYAMVGKFMPVVCEAKVAGTQTYKAALLARVNSPHCARW